MTLVFCPRRPPGDHDSSREVLSRSESHLARSTEASEDLVVAFAFPSFDRSRFPFSHMLFFCDVADQFKMFVPMAGVFDIIDHYEYEAGRGVEEYSPMKPGTPPFLPSSFHYFPFHLIPLCSLDLCSFHFIAIWSSHLFSLTLCSDARRVVLCAILAVHHS